MKNQKAYYLDIQTHRKNPYGLLRHSYREDGKIKKETMCRFTGLTLAQLKGMQAALRGNTVAIDEIKITSSREYGASYACIEIMKNLGLHKSIFSRPNEEWVRASMAMIAGRIVYPGSKLSLAHRGTHSAIWEICGIENADVDTHCYEAMDRLFERQEAIEKSLAAKHLSDGCLVLYDITSSYLEGEYSDSELVEFGYNRDKKRGHEQIVISLLCNKDGCPIATKVLKGNTKDETTVLDQINDLKLKYGVKKAIFVGDRGMVTQSKYDEINHNDISVITALSHAKIKELCANNVIQLSLFDEENIVEVIGENNLRYCLCKNPLLAVEETKSRETLLQKTAEKLDGIVGCKRKTKYSKEVRIGRIIDKYKMAKFVIISGTGDDISWKFDQDKINQEQLFDGCYVVYTDVPATEMSAVETVKNYKNLIQVEQAFRNLKTARLEVRPIFHKTDDRIKCHVFICMLSYYVMWHMNQKLKPIFDSDGVGKNRKFTFDYIIESLKCIRQEEITLCENTSHIITTPNEEQNHILQLLEIAI